MATGQYIGVNGVARKVVSPYIGVNGVARNVKSGYVGVDGVARLFFAPESGGAVVLEVEKITSDTYANETTYTAEEFILLDIYPKTGGTVNVTYGGLTKTITDTSGAAEPNAQRVFFGTFNGVSDSVATPTSGELTIEGDCAAFGAGKYQENAKSYNKLCGCIISVKDWGSVSYIPAEAFGSKAYGSPKLTDITIPKSIKSIGNVPFGNCSALQNITVDAANEHYASENGILFNKNKTEVICYPPSLGFESYVIPLGVEIIHDCAFHFCNNLMEVTIPTSVTSIGANAFLLGNGSPARTVKVMSATPVTLSTYAFNYPGTNNIVVPKGCGDAYKTAEGWSTYADYIVEAT